MIAGTVFSCCYCSPCWHSPADPSSCLCCRVLKQGARGVGFCHRPVLFVGLFPLTVLFLPPCSW